MFKELIKVFGETIVYGLTGVASTLASVFLIPIYTRILTPGDYGVIALLSTFSNIIGVIAAMGMGSAVFWAYFRAKGEERPSVVGTSFIFQTLFPLLISAVIFLMSGSISQLLFGSTGNAYLVELAAVALFFNAGIAVPLALLRAEGHPTNFVSINLVRLLSTLFISIVLVAVLRYGLAGVFWASLIGSALGYLAGLVYTFKRISFTFSKYWFLEMLKFGAPMMPAGLAIWTLNSSDRYFLNAFASTADVGIYNIGYKVGSLIALIVSALQLAYPRFLWSVFHDKPNPKDYYKKIVTYFFLINLSAAFTISIFSREAVKILTGSAFHSAYIVVPFVAFSYVAYGLFQSFGTGVTVVRKTYFSALAALGAAVFNLFMNYVLISRFGMMGAAVSTLLSFAFLAFLELRFSQRVYPINFEFGRMLKATLAGVALVIAASFLNLDILPSLLVKSLLFLVFPALLYLFGFFEERELKKLSRIWLFVKKSRFRPKKIFDGLKQEIIA